MTTEWISASRHLRVALLIESSRGYGRKLLKGIATYARAHGPWTFFQQERDLGDPLPRDLKRWRPQAIIARLSDERLIGEVRKLALPTVDLYHEDDTKHIPGVAINQASLVRLALEHFLERGFRHFAYCGFPGVLFSDLRAVAFVEAVTARGLRVELPDWRKSDHGGGLAAVEAAEMRRGGELAKWLRELPRPTALLACNDMRAQQVMTVCDEAGVRVPDDMAVLGIDNDDVLCDLCDPPLSSIDPNVERIGYEAAALLDRLVHGGPPPRTRILVEPRGVVARRSTDALAVADREAAEAVRFVRDHACQQDLGIGDIVEHLAISRATLNRWFRKWLGRSPAEEIARVRLERAKDLLATTDLPLEEIARRCGFRYAESVCRAMKRTTGKLTAEYRKRRPPDETHG